jgi:hypothetical protein
MKVRQTTPYYGFNHDKVKVKFEGFPEFQNEFCVRDRDYPVAVYRVNNPNREKGHKDYLLLWTDPIFNTTVLSGMDKEEMEKERYQNALHCLECDEVMYSVYIHHYAVCSCGNVSIDGGKSYSHTTVKDASKCKPVKIDLLTLEVVPSGH